MAKVPFPCCCSQVGCGDYGGTWYAKFCNYSANTDSCLALAELDGTEISFAAPASSANSITNTEVQLGSAFGCAAAGLFAADIASWKVQIQVGEAGGRTITVRLFGYASGDYDGTVVTELIGRIDDTCAAVFDAPFLISFEDLSGDPITTSATIEVTISKSSGIVCGPAIPPPPI